MIIFVVVEKETNTAVYAHGDEEMAKARAKELDEGAAATLNKPGVPRRRRSAGDTVSDAAVVKAVEVLREAGLLRYREDVYGEVLEVVGLCDYVVTPVDLHDFESWDPRGDRW